MGYTKGLHEIADGVWAYLQPDGGWGWSNAGLITGDDDSLLVDTLFDLRLTAEMLELMRATTPAAHAHRHGGQHACQRRPLLRQRAARVERRSSRPRAVPRRCWSCRRPPWPPCCARRTRSGLRARSRRGSSPPSPSRTSRSPCRPGPSSSNWTCRSAVAPSRCSRWAPPTRRATPSSIWPRRASSSPATSSSMAGHPIVWAGPVANWIAACDRVLALQPTVVVPGHGPLATPRRPGGPQGVLRAPDPGGQGPLRGRDDAAGCGPRHRPGPLCGVERGRAGRGQRPCPLPRLRRRVALRRVDPAWARWPLWPADQAHPVSDHRPETRPRARRRRRTTRDGPSGYTTPVETRTAPLIGGRYRIDGLLGEGGMARVFDAFDERLERPAAVKILRAETRALPGHAATVPAGGADRRPAPPPPHRRRAGLRRGPRVVVSS